LVVPVIEGIDEIRAAVHDARSAGQVIGLVPTMGALHAGHTALVERARAETGFVVVSIFVNPTQFGPNEDFNRYPRSPEHDNELCSRAGADVIFAPMTATIYPCASPATFVEVPGLSHVLEGASRRGHFRGVATMVLKLFTIVAPNVAYFGEKDYQQLLVIRRLVEDLNVPVAVRAVATVREPDGLALSSRNRYLDPAERQAATVLSRALRQARDLVEHGQYDAGRVRQVLQETLESQAGVALDYADVADAETLEPLVRLDPGRRAVALVAARVGPARLIDNLVLID
jgi:pantoate--beta-alanine ligase